MSRPRRDDEGPSDTSVLKVAVATAVLNEASRLLAEHYKTTPERARDLIVSAVTALEQAGL